MQNPPKIPHPPHVHTQYYPYHNHCCPHGVVIHHHHHQHPPFSHFHPPLLLFHHHHHHHHRPPPPTFNATSSANPLQLTNGDQQVVGSSAVGLENEDLRENLNVEEEEEGDDVFVMTDEWKEFFAKSEAKRKLKKRQGKKGGW